MIEKIRRDNPDLVLLDLNLPGTDGLTICKGVREFSNIPIIMLTAKIEEVDRLLGYEIGADDYICKPVRAQEILARVRAVLRRVNPEAADKKPDRFRVEKEAMRIFINDRVLDLTPLEFRILATMGKYPGRVFSRLQLLDTLRDEHNERAVGERTIDTHVKNIRKKIMDAADGLDPINSVYGVGYRLEWN